MLRHLGRTLAEAVAESSDAHRVLEHLRAEGYGLYLLLDRHGRLDRHGFAAEDIAEIDPSSSVEPTEGFDTELGGGPVREMWNKKTAALEPPEDVSGSAPAAPEPTFRINQSDLAFLRSVGIDPTRRVKSRTKNRR